MVYKVDDTLEAPLSSGTDHAHRIQFILVVEVNTNREASLPLLDNNTASLEIGQFAQDSTLVCQLLAGECSHQYPRTRLARWTSRCYKRVYIAHGVGGVETRCESGTVSKANLQSDHRL